MPDPIYDVFLSYASRDRTAVEALARRLKAEGLRPFLDDWELIPGEGRQEGLEAALGNSRTLAAFVGNGEIGPWQNEEIRDALDTRTKDKGYRVIPVLLPGASKPEDDALPRFLRRLTWVRFRHDLEDKAAFHRLVSGIKGLAPGSDDRPPTEAETLAVELDAAYETLHEQEEQELDTREIRAQILSIRRKLRDGGLKAGYRLAEGRYKLIRRVGKGGFAEVWKAYDRTRREHVAIKILHQQFCEDKTRRERFARGAKQMANLNHQNIVSVLEEVREDAGRYYFVMEFCEGGDFQRAVREGRLDMEQRWGVILKVGDALQFAHERGVIHRDVKPANILLAADGLPKLTDFDLVRAAETTGGTRTGAMGTFVYAAPEMLSRPQDAAESADVYGLGMTAIFAACGRDLPLSILRDPIRVLERHEVLTKASETFIHAVEWEQARRWPSVREFCKALDRTLKTPGPSSIKSAHQRKPIFSRSSGPPVLLSSEDPHTPEVGSVSAQALESLVEARYVIRAAQARLRSGGKLKGVDEKALVQELVAAMQYRHLPPPERCQAGVLASSLGHLPEDLDSFVTLPEDWFGYPLEIARYPVTNAQYRRFMEDGGFYNNRVRNDRVRKEPRFWNDPSRNCATQPVVGIDLYEANAYCRWLTASMQAAGEIGEDQHVRLPTFEERKKVAEGWTGRKFPWGDEEEVYRLNCKESGIGLTSPVHMYPDGATPEGVWDLSGNVWEWTRSMLRDHEGTYFLMGSSHYKNSPQATSYAWYCNDATSSRDRYGFRVSRCPLIE